MNHYHADEIVRGVTEAVTEAIGPADGDLVLLHGPLMPAAASRYVQDCVDTGWVSSAGQYVTRFEEQLAAATGSARAVAMVNGTAALEMCFRLSGVCPGDEVVCPSLTFVATANAISHCGAVPHFVDVSEDRLSICPQALRERFLQIASSGAAAGTCNRETGRRIAAVCLMHCFGHPGDIDGIRSVCDEFGVELIEDAAESLGSTYRGTHTGRFSKASAVSFNGNKIITTGGGGALLTDDEKLADHAKHLTTTAKQPDRWEFFHDEVAWNYRMPNLNAAIGVAQLEILPAILDAKRTIAERYQAAFAELGGIQVMQQPTDSQSNCWLNTLVLDDSLSHHRDAILTGLNSASYQCRPVWQPMHTLPMYANSPRGSMKRTESLAGRVINVPSSVYLSPSWCEAKS